MKPKTRYSYGRGILIFGVLLLLEVCLFGYAYQHNPSSSCLNCNLFLEMGSFCIPFLLLYSLLEWLGSHFQRRYPFAFRIVFFTGSCFSVNMLIFKARIADWTTYTTRELLWSVSVDSLLPVLLFTVIYALVVATVTSLAKQRKRKETFPTA